MPEENRFQREVDQFKAESAQEHRKDAEWLSRMAILGAGATVFGRSVGRNFFADAADLTGRGARFLGSIGRRVEPEFAPEKSDTLYKVLGIHPDAGGRSLTLGIGGARAGELDSIQDLAEALRLLQKPELHSNRAQLEDLLAQQFRNLPRSAGRDTTSGFHHDLQPLTFGELMDRSHDWISNVGSLRFQTVGASGKRVPLSIGIVEKALDMKWIDRDTIVDANLFTTTGGRVVDMRITNPKAATVALSKVFDIAGIFKAASDFMNGGRMVSEVNPGRVKLPRFVIGGNLYESSGDGISKLASNQVIGTMGDKRFEPSTLRRAASGGYLSSLYTPDTGSGLYNKIQEATGVGTKFHDKQGVGLPFIRNIFRNISMVGRGEATFYARDYKLVKENPLGRFAQPFAPEVDFVGATGKEFTKGKFHGRGFMDKSALSRKERMLAYMGMNPDVAILRGDAMLAIRPNRGHLAADFGRSGIKSLENPIGMRSPARGATGVDQLGNLEYTERASHYATDASLLSRGRDFGNYMAMRLNALASSTGLGISFRPGGSLLGNVTRLAAIPATYMAGVEALSYANYATEQVTGVNPAQTLATAYTKLRVAQQQAREATGISAAANYMETALLPGLSAGLMGTIGAMAMGIRSLGKGASYARALLSGGAVYGAVGGPNVGESPEEIEAIYAGEQKVAIRKARWWGLGYQPFRGGEIDHYAPSWYRKLMDQPSMANIYGGEDNYWKNVSLLPTPSNLFGLKPLLDPYWLERRNYYNRPYPVTGGMLEEVPIFGPVLADTIGAAIKPRRRMHTQAANVATANISERGVPENVATQLGIPSIPNALVDLNRPDVLRDRVSKWANVGLEPMGIWKFAMEFFGVNLDDDYTMADAGNMNSISRSFYGLNLGGLGGQTEFIRRFLMSDYGNPSKINQQINPIANTMPRWLPGSMSEYEEDRSYFVDYTRGDAYTKISGGEYRLPGAGYEAVNRLHSGQTGVYDDVDRLMVLADVAPNSKAFFKTKAKVQSMHLSPYWQGKVEQALQQRENKLDKYGFNSQEIVAAANLNPLARGIRSSWDMLYNMGSEIPLFGSKFAPRRDPLEHYVKYQVEGDTFADWQRPVETIVRPAIYDVIGSDPITGVAKGAMLGGLLAAPLAKFMNPITVTTLNMGSNMAIGGAVGGILSTGRMVGTGNIEGGLIPSHVRTERKVNEYFDYLQYSKYANLANMADDNRVRDAFMRQAERTTAFGLAQLQSTGEDYAYSSSLSKDEKQYYRAFKNASALNRDRILEYVPSHMRTALRTVWGQDETTGEGGHRVARRRTAEYFESHTTPGANWAGWSPEIPMSAIKIKSVEAGIRGNSSSAHRYGYFPAQQMEADLRFPFLEPITDIRKKPRRNQYSPVHDIFGDYVPFGNVRGLDFGTGPEVTYTKTYVEDNRRDDVFSFFQINR